MNKTVRTPGAWRQLIDEQAKSPNKGRFPLLPRRMFNSPAFAALDRSGMVCVLAMLDKLYLEKTNKRKGVKSTVIRYQNNGQFTITTNELKARGLKSKETVAKGKRQAQELGFFDVLQSGDVFRAGQFRYSDRWERYPDGDYSPNGQPPPGTNLGYGFLPNREDHENSKSRSEIESRRYVRKSNVVGEQALRPEIERSLSEDAREKTTVEAEKVNATPSPSVGPKTERNNYLPVPRQPEGCPKNEAEMTATARDRLTNPAQKKNHLMTKQEKPDRSKKHLDWPVTQRIGATVKTYGHGDVVRSSFGSIDRSVKLKFGSGLELVITPHDFSINGAQISNSDFDRVLNHDGKQTDSPDRHLPDPLMELRKTLWRCQSCGWLDDNGYICRYSPDGKDLYLVQTVCRVAQAAATNSGEEPQ